MSLIHKYRRRALRGLFASRLRQRQYLRNNGLVRTNTDEDGVETWTLKSKNEQPKTESRSVCRKDSNNTET